MALRPSERNRSAPVVCCQHNRTGDSQFRGDGIEVIDPRRKEPRRPQPLGIAHSELVNRDNPPACVRASQKATPQIGPSRIAVHAKKRSYLWLDPVVEHVPGAQHAFGVDRLDQFRPSRIEVGHPTDVCRDAGRGDQLVDHQTISAYEVFSPDPMPINRMRSAARSWSICRASVNGIAAGPMLP